MVTDTNDENLVDKRKGVVGIYTKMFKGLDLIYILNKCSAKNMKKKGGKNLASLSRNVDCNFEF